MSLNLPIRWFYIVGCLAIVFIVGVGVVTGEAKQLLCRFFYWRVGGFLGVDCGPPPPPNPPYLYFNYSVAGVSPTVANAVGMQLQNGSLKLEQLPTIFQFSPACTYSANDPSTLMLTVQGQPSPPAPTGMGDITFGEHANLPMSDSSCSTQFSPFLIFNIETSGAKLVLNQQTASGDADIEFQQSGGAPIEFKTLPQGNPAGGFFELTLWQYDNSPGGAVRANFELLLRNDSDPNSTTLVLITNGQIAVSH